MVHEDYKELLAAKALDALDPADARSLDAHLQSCAECRGEMLEWEETAAFLAFDAGRVEPSPELRQRILASVRVDSERTADLGQNSAAATSPDVNVLAFERRARKSFAWSSMAAIAASLVAVALLASLVVLWQQNQKTRAELANLTAQMEEAKARLAREREAMALLTSPGAKMASLSGTKDAPGARAMLAFDQSGHAMLMAKGLPAVPRGMAYQLWFIKDNKKMPGKVFMPDAAGNGMLEDEIPAVAREAGVFAITLEPESGVQTPTGAIYLVSAT